MKYFAALFTSLLFMVGPDTIGQTAASSSVQESKTFRRKITKTLKADYLLFLPQGYQARGKKLWPLMIFLHGAGERGADLQKVAVHGPPKVVKTRPDFPFILASPQCPDGERWSNDVVLGLLDDLVKRHRVDTNRVYLTGLSMGGFGTWSLGMRHPERFAAIVPICGGGEVIDVLLAGQTRVSALKSLGIWGFHGAKDTVVNLEESERMVNALKRAGVKDVKLTVYPDAGHDSWTETYQNPKLYEWFLQHKRGPTN